MPRLLGITVCNSDRKGIPVLINVVALLLSYKSPVSVIMYKCTNILVGIPVIQSRIMIYN